MIYSLLEIMRKKNAKYSEKCQQRSAKKIQRCVRDYLKRVRSLYDIIHNNQYIKLQKNKNYFDNDSLFSHICSNYDQGQKLKLVKAIEDVLKDFIQSRKPNFVFLDSTFQINIRQHIICDRLSKKIYFFKFQTNTKKISIDQLVIDNLKETYPQFDICPYVVCLRYLYVDHLPQNWDFVIGVNEMFDVLDIMYFFDYEKDFFDMIEYIGKEMFFSMPTNNIKNCS